MGFSSNFNSEIDGGNPLYAIYDLSIIEILIVNELVKLTRNDNYNKVSILRHDLYKLINNLVKSHKKLSTSSFYRSLKKLQERGFLEFKKSEDIKYRKATEVYPTPLATQIIGFLFHFMVQYNQDIEVLNFIDQQLESYLNQFISVEQLRKIRVVDPSVRIDSPADLITSILPNAIGIMQVVANMVMTHQNGSTRPLSVNVLSTEQIFEWDEKIDAGSDLIIFPLYEKNSTFRGLTHLQIIDELKKLLAKNRFMLVIHLDTFQARDHHYLDIIASFLKNSPFFQTYDSEQIIHDLEPRQLICRSQFSYRGVSFLLFEKL